MGTIRPSALAIGLFGSVLSVAGCVLPPPAGELAPPRVEVLTAESGATRYGRSAAEVFEHPAIRDRVRALFGRDWSAGREGGLSAAASLFFSTGPPPKALRVGAREYLGVSGCMATACTTRRGLVLIGAEGERLLARVDDGGFTFHYGFGPGMTAMSPQDRLLVDAAWGALR